MFLHPISSRVKTENQRDFFEVRALLSLRLFFSCFQLLYDFRFVHLSSMRAISIVCVHTGSCGHLLLVLLKLCSCCFILSRLYEFKLESSTRTHTLKGLCVYRLCLPGGHSDAGDFLLFLSLGITGCWNFPRSLKMLPVLDTVFSFMPNTECLHDLNDCSDILLMYL